MQRIPQPRPTAPDGSTTGQPAAIGTILTVCSTSYGLLLPGICQGLVSGVVLLPCYKFITRGGCYADLFSSAADHRAMATHPFFQAKEKQLLQQDAKSSPQCSICPESSTIKGCGINFALRKGGNYPLLPFEGPCSAPVAPWSSSSAGTQRLCTVRGKDAPTPCWVCGQEHFGGCRVCMCTMCGAIHMEIFSKPRKRRGY